MSSGFLYCTLEVFPVGGKLEQVTPEINPTGLNPPYIFSTFPLVSPSQPLLLELRPLFLPPASAVEVIESIPSVCMCDRLLINTHKMMSIRQKDFKMSDAGGV